MSNELAARILYCDNNFIVVNKIAGEAVEGAGKGMVDLPRQLAAVLPPEEKKAPTSRNISEPPIVRPVAVHRLDVPVSGCAVFARTGEALRFLNSVFSGNNVEKKYWAIVEQPPGLPENGVLFSENAACELVHWLQFDPRRNKSTAYDEQKQGQNPEPGGQLRTSHHRYAVPLRKKAILRYRPVGRGRDYLFMEIETVSGRHHQIRAQLERIGLHIKGDLKYGARRSEKNGGIRLHARSISFPNFSEKNNITIIADPPVRDNLWIAFEEAAGTVSAFPGVNC